MPLIGIASGPASDVGDQVRTCPRSVYWTIQVKNGNPGSNAANLADLVLEVKVAEANYEATTDEDGYITLVFSPGTNCTPIAVSLTHDTYKWQGPANAAARVDTYHFQSTAPLKWVWKLVVRVNDATGERTPMKDAKILLAWATETDDSPRTKSGGGAFQKLDIPAPFLIRSACHKT